MAEVLTTRDRILIGAVSGAIAAAVTFPIAAYDVVLAFTRDPTELIAFALRVAGSAVVGAGWVWGAEEKSASRPQLFKAGLLAPALILGLLSANAPGTKLDAIAAVPPPPSPTVSAPAPGAGQPAPAGALKGIDWSRFLFATFGRVPGA